MDLLDIIIILFVISLAARGFAAGFFRQAGSLLGLILGLALGISLAPVVARLAHTVEWRSLLALATLLALISLLSGVGEWIGGHVRSLLHRIRLSTVDEWGGAGLGIVIGLLLMWVMASLVARLPLYSLQNQIQRSVILRSLDAALPPAPDVLAKFGRLLAPNGFPQVFSGLEPSPAPPVTGPNAAAVNAAAAAGRAATVRIEGLGCGGVVEGSGFVAGSGLVGTNAHVVAGIKHPIVFDAAGSHQATVVWFDPDLDFAVLRTSGLAAPPLPLATAHADRGTIGAVLGYPGGGPFTVSPAAVLAERTAVGRNIYDAGLVTRHIYELQADVRPGNSGGPLVSPDGTVIGVVFAASLAQPGIGYALTAPDIAPELTQAATHAPVSTSRCAAE